MRTAPLTAAALFCVSLLAPIAVGAQDREYVTHRTYTPPNGEDPQAFFARAYPGMPVADRPGFVWRHDSGGWYRDLATTQAPDPVPDPALPPETVPTDASCPPAETFNPYTLTPAQVLACVPRRLLPFAAADGTRYGYSVGEVYGPKLYPTGERVIVLSVVNDVNTPRRVVTVKWLRGPQTGELAVFYEDEKRFVPLTPNETR